MAIAAACVHNIQTDGSAATAGGGWVTGATGTDYSKTLVANLPANNTVTTATSLGAGNVLQTAQASADWVGNTVIPTAGTFMTLTAGIRYEIVSVNPGISVTFSTNYLGGSISTGLSVGASFIVGGAAAFYNSATDDVLLENSVAGHKWMIKTGSHSVGAIALSAVGTTVLPLIFEGYVSTHGDKPTGVTRPVLAMSSTNALTLGTFTDLTYLIVLAASTTTIGLKARVIHCKVFNRTTTGSQTALSMVGGCSAIYVEAISYRGNAMALTNVTGYVESCFFHDSVCGISLTGGSATSLNLFNSVIAHCSFNAIGKATTSAIIDQVSIIKNNILYGALDKFGLGLNLASTSSAIRFLNNIVYGFTTGVVHPDAGANQAYDDGNCYYNNTLDVTAGNWTKGTNDIALDPAFSVSHVTFATATTAGSTITQVGATFVTSGVLGADASGCPQHFVYLSAGTGTAVGYYGITSVTETTLVVDVTLAASAVADHVGQIMVGRNFMPGSNIKGEGVPLLLAGLATSSYYDIGPFQRKEDYPVVGDVKTGVVYSNSELTGTQANITGGGGGGGYISRR
jgi:hypothetical protein